MISASRAAVSRLVGTAASRGPTAARHQVRDCRALPEGLTVLGLSAAGRARPSGSESSGKEERWKIQYSVLLIQGLIQGFAFLSLLSHTPWERRV